MKTRFKHPPESFDTRAAGRDRADGGSVEA